jgi:hypothetical protein
MALGWKITAVTKRLGAGPPLTEWFVVAVSDQSLALAMLRERHPDAELTVVGEASDNMLAGFDVGPCQIFCVMAML